MSAAVAGDLRSAPGGARPALAGTLRLWTPCFAAALAVHLGIAAALLVQSRDLADGGALDAINIDLMPDPSMEAARPDDVAGPQVTESVAATSQTMEADDPEPPAPDSPAPTEVERKLKEITPEFDAPSVSADSAVTLQKPIEKQPDAEKAETERQTAASRASAGSAGLLGGGRRPSPAAQATWTGEIKTHLVRFRRFPPEARAEGHQGTARVSVTIDGDGHVLGREIVKSSGYPALDREALELMTRSDPLPRPPVGMPAPIRLTVPVNFAIR